MSASALLAEVHEEAATVWRKIGAAAEALAIEAPPVICADLEPVLASVGIPAALVDELAIAIRAIAAHHASIAAAPAPRVDVQAPEPVVAHPVPS